MQHIPDKEFDNLFKDKFKDAEIEPSTNLWANIEKELAPKRKRTFPVYWMAAATIVVAFTAILVFQEKKVIKLHLDETAKVKPTINDDTVVKPIVAPQTVEQASPMVAKTATVNRAVEEKVVTPKNKVIENKSQNIQVVMQPSNTNEHLPIKQQDARPIDVIPVKVVPDNPIVIAQATSTEKIDQNVITESSNERKGIRNVGDLVNFVVEKVDKRDKKLVRFNTDDDDNSSIIGINIGFLKFNKKNKEQR